MRVIERDYFTYDDVLLRPQHSTVQHRKHVNVTTRLGNLLLTTPIVSANMDTVTGPEMIKAMANYGGLGILHRFLSIEIQVKQLEDLATDPYLKLGFSVGVGEESRDRFERSIKLFPGTTGRLVICVDIAHGDSEEAVKMTRFIAERKRGATLIVGNVATGEGVKRLIEAGADVIKVGIGPGSLCTTRLVTGHGVPQLSAVMEAVEAAKGTGVDIVADGGIRYPGDAVKALAAGASAVMLGRALAGCDEAAGITLEYQKEYRGMASREAQNQMGKTSTPEGAQMYIMRTGPVKSTLDEYIGGIRSGCSYSGAYSLIELHENAEFIRVSANSVKENGAHGK